MSSFTTQVTVPWGTAAASTVSATGVTTSQGLYVGDRKHLSVQFSAASITSGNSVFTCQVSNDATTWTAYNRLTTNVTNTNAQTDTRVASVTVSANSTVGGVGGTYAFFPETDHFAYVRFIATVTTDGTYTGVLHSIY